MQYVDTQVKISTKSVVRNALWLGFTLIVFVGLVKLSFWQYDRGLEKERRAARITQLNQQSPLTLKEIVRLSKEKQFTGKESINDFPVTINGQFNENYIFLLDNQVEKTSLGYRVLQVVETATHAVLVNLGWVQGSIDRSILPEVIPLQGHYTFKGHVRIVEQGIMLAEQDFTQASWPLRVQQIELAKFSTLINKAQLNKVRLNKPLLPFVIYVDQEENLGYKKNWHPIVMPAEKHFGYAFQWATLAIAWLILMICLRINTAKLAGRHPSHSAQSCADIPAENTDINTLNNNNKHKAVKYD
ncbi:MULTISPECIES: SURF1 family protein [Colwellia]|uniref:SURF1-like protein n=1 Tax=Colwellia marinimaniae TaxID=1513592 RepID=A0ABQ0MRT7_9GAMM|nr:MULTISPECIES: SURF1 family protein [Colwellia]GAW95074.1 SURF1-like protein [Colwellia marinimaniae]